jgi:hypothetical protein
VVVRVAWRQRSFHTGELGSHIGFSLLRLRLTSGLFHKYHRHKYENLLQGWVPCMYLLGRPQDFPRFFHDSIRVRGGNNVQVPIEAHSSISFVLDNEKGLILSDTPVCLFFPSDPSFVIHAHLQRPLYMVPTSWISCLIDVDSFSGTSCLFLVFST